MKKTILVTGGAGFIGSHLCERLLERGNRVLCVDNFSTGSKKNIEALLVHPDFVLIEHDIIEQFSIDEPVHEIYNLACPASPVQYQKNPIHTIQTNTVGVMHVLEVAKEKGATILQASTSEVYGDPEIHPQYEEYRGSVNCIGPRACYDEGKRCAEALFFDYHRGFGVPIKVVRIFNTYGPKMALDDGRVVSNLVLQALRGEQMTVFGDGSQTRSFCFVDDLVRGFIAMMESPLAITGPINLGNPEEITITEFAERVRGATKTQSEVVYRPIPQDDPTRRRPDITKAKQLLDWEPTFDLKTGLQITIDYFRTQV